jgi:site-specific DNA-methyltransferase (adenine-specific)
MDIKCKSKKEMILICKERNIKGYSGKTKEQLIQLIEEEGEKDEEGVVEEVENVIIKQDIIQGDSIEILPTIDSDIAQIIIADPPYNIGKDFGNNSDKQSVSEYLEWCDKWIKDCIRILKPNGTMFIYGFSETLALILSRVPEEINRRWIIWHYTNKNVPSLQFWQRSHESIIVLWKTEKVFNRDEIREPYTEEFLNGSAGKKRTSTKGRFSNGQKTTTYTAHTSGALPRDVIKIPALAGGAGAKERVQHPTQKPLALCEKLLKSCMQKDGLVLIPFAGSGSECVAAKNLNLPFIGIEINPDYIELIKSRLTNFSNSAESEILTNLDSTSV